MPQPITKLPPLPTRPSDAHKGTFGRVLIVAGGTGMSGAAALAGLGALRGGAGLTYVAVPAVVLPVVAGIDPSFLTIPLEDDRRGRLSAHAMDTLHSALAGKDAAGIGPGLGQGIAIEQIVREIYTTAILPMVIDADGLNALAKTPALLSQHPAPRILTPHPGEFARLTGSDIKTVQAHREEMATQFAAEHKIILILKGQGTVVTDGARVYVNTTGNSGMATGGTGDVLTGLLTALLAQKMAPFDAAQLGVYLHGLAGDIAAETGSQPGMIASDVAAMLTTAWKRILPSNQP